VADQNAEPVLGAGTSDEILPYSFRVRMMDRKFDAKLSHHPAGRFFTVDDHGEFMVSFQNLGLLPETRWSDLRAGHHLTCLAEDPWISDTASSHGNRLDTTGLEHQEDIFDTPDVS
jgi:hypothetical protein